VCFERADSRSFGQDGLTNRQLYHNVKQNHFYFYSYTSAVKSFLLKLTISFFCACVSVTFCILDCRCAMRWTGRLSRTLAQFTSGHSHWNNSDECSIQTVQWLAVGYRAPFHSRKRLFVFAVLFKKVLGQPSLSTKLNVPVVTWLDREADH
jgi:hypothetical protein